jgi:two-component sensor histidine kinase
MDLTERKQAEEVQKLLLNELNHRVKNTLATIQAITAQTLRAANDLPSARQAVDRRIRSMAKAHDLLTLRAWSGASLTDVARSGCIYSGPGANVRRRHRGFAASMPLRCRWHCTSLPRTLSNTEPSQVPTAE